MADVFHLTPGYALFVTQLGGGLTSFFLHPTKERWVLPMLSRIVPSMTTIAVGLLLATLLALALTMVGSSMERGISARPAEAASAVGVTVGCYGNPEVTRVKNNTNHRITIKSVGSIYQP